MAFSSRAARPGAVSRVLDEELVERGLELDEGACVPHSAQFGADPRADGDIGRRRDGIGSKVELASLPGGGAYEWGGGRHAGRRDRRRR